MTCIIYPLYVGHALFTRFTINIYYLYPITIYSAKSSIFHLQLYACITFLYMKVLMILERQMAYKS